MKIEFRCLTVLTLAVGGLVLVLRLLGGPMPARAQVLPQGQRSAPQSTAVTAALAPTHAVSDTIEAASCEALSNASITGPMTGTLGAAYTFTATVSPATSTLPITYTWKATSHTPVTHTVYSVSDTVVFTWDVTGTQTVTVTAVNECGVVVSNTHSISIKAEIRYVYLPVVLRSYPPAWKQGGNTNNIHLRAPSGCGSTTWYAGGFDAGVWESTDNAENWTQIVSLAPNPYPVVANPNNCDQAFVSVWGTGIYLIKEDHSTQDVTSDLGEDYVYGLAITGTTLYAGTNSQGVYKTDISSIDWEPKNSGLNEKRIRSLAVIGNEVYAGARNCKLYQSSDGGDSWSEYTVPATGGCEDAQVWSMAKVKTTLYAGLGLNKGLYRNGGGWQKVNAIPDRTLHGLAYDGENDYLYVSTDGAGIYRCGVDETGVVQECQQHNPGLTTLNMHELKIHNELLVAGSEDGIWYLPLFR